MDKYREGLETPAAQAAVAAINETRNNFVGGVLGAALGQLDVLDPTFPQKFAATLNKYSEGVDTAAAKAVIDLVNQEYARHIVAQQNTEVAADAADNKTAPKTGKSSDSPEEREAMSLSL